MSFGDWQLEEMRKKYAKAAGERDALAARLALSEQATLTHERLYEEAVERADRAEARLAEAERKIEGWKRVADSLRISAASWERRARELGDMSPVAESTADSAPACQRTTPQRTESEPQPDKPAPYGFSVGRELTRAECERHLRDGTAPWDATVFSASGLEDSADDTSDPPCAAP